MRTTTIKHFTINLKTKPYLKKYVQAKYGHPIKLDNSNILAATVLACLSKTCHDGLHKTDRDIRYKHFTSEILFQIVASKIHSYHHGLHISMQQIIVINRWIEEEFENYLHHWCNCQQLNGEAKTRKQAIEKFAELFNIDIYGSHPDISYWGLKKSDDRTKEKLKKLSDALLPFNQQPRQILLFQ